MIEMLLIEMSKTLDLSGLGRHPSGKPANWKLPFYGVSAKCLTWNELTDIEERTRHNSSLPENFSQVGFRLINYQIGHSLT